MISAEQALFCAALKAGPTLLFTCRGRPIIHYHGLAIKAQPMWPGPAPTQLQFHFKKQKMQLQFLPRIAVARR